MASSSCVPLLNLILIHTLSIQIVRPRLYQRDRPSAACRLTCFWCLLTDRIPLIPDPQFEASQIGWGHQVSSFLRASIPILATAEQQVLIRRYLSLEVLSQFSIIPVWELCRAISRDNDEAFTLSRQKPVA